MSQPVSQPVARAREVEGGRRTGHGRGRSLRGADDRTGSIGDRESTRAALFLCARVAQRRCWSLTAAVPSSACASAVFHRQEDSKLIVPVGCCGKSTRDDVIPKVAILDLLAEDLTGVAVEVEAVNNEASVVRRNRERRNRSSNARRTDEYTTSSHNTRSQNVFSRLGKGISAKPSTSPQD